MTEASLCRCPAGHDTDPTIEFQRSGCCGARLVRKKCHYACTHCGKAIPSKFLFDERLFDREYFRELMRESRERKRRNREEIRRWLSNTRSDAFHVAEFVDIDSVPGLEADLDLFVGSNDQVEEANFFTKSEFRMSDYRKTILEAVFTCSVKFGAIPSICKDIRLERSRRFRTLIFMVQNREVDLTQYGNDILVERHEAHA
ncbi:hypothetical protein ACFL1X_01440 [Candidatus Hydrogenedentota bacterium]